MQCVRPIQITSLRHISIAVPATHLLTKEGEFCFNPYCSVYCMIPYLHTFTHSWVGFTERHHFTKAHLLASIKIRSVQQKDRIRLNSSEEKKSVCLNWNINLIHHHSYNPTSSLNTQKSWISIWLAVWNNSARKHAVADLMYLLVYLLENTIWKTSRASELFGYLWAVSMW